MTTQTAAADHSGFTPRFGHRLVLAAILGLAAGLRLAHLDTVPPGLWFDEALNGQDAYAAWMKGDFKLVYPDEFPREPMYETVLALAVGAFGPRVVVLRGVSAAIGILTVLLLYMMLRRETGEPVALASAAALAVMRWHVLFSRLVFRTLVLPLWLILIVWAALAWRRKPTLPRAMLLGALVGAGFYTYLAWYFMLPLVALILCALAFGWFAPGSPSQVGRGYDPTFSPPNEETHVSGHSPDLLRIRLAHMALALGVAALVFLPLGVHYKHFPDHLLNRATAVSPWSDGVGAGLRQVGKNALEALGMFHVRGDHVPIQNIPRRPALDYVQGILMLYGLGLCIRALVGRADAVPDLGARASRPHAPPATSLPGTPISRSALRLPAPAATPAAANDDAARAVSTACATAEPDECGRDARAPRGGLLSLIVLAWFVCGMLPTILTKTDSPNFLRTLCLTPALAILIGLALADLASRLSRARRPALAGAIPALLILGSLALTYTDLFIHWSRRPDVWRAFKGPIVQLARIAEDPIAASDAPDSVLERNILYMVPSLLYQDRTFQFLLLDRFRDSLVRSLGGGLFLIYPYDDWRVIQPSQPYIHFINSIDGRSEPGVVPVEDERWIVATANNGLASPRSGGRPSPLEELAPNGRVVHEFKTPEGYTWAVIYAIRYEDLPTREAFERVLRDYPHDLRF